MSYGRNFEFRSHPKGAERAGRYYLDSPVNIPIGAPVKLSGKTDAVGRLGVELATGAQAKPTPGTGGIAVFEHIQYIDVDPFLTTYSDMDFVPAGAPLQVVNGTAVKVAYTNTTDTSFLTRTGYPTARVMVSGVSNASSLAVGELLTPGPGNDEDGYWVETGTAANGWLVVTAVDNSTGLVEARLNF